jgi:uncharacterized protein (TIGR03435 family)
MGASRFFTALVPLVVSSLARSQQFTNIDIKPSSSAFSASRLQVLPTGELIGHSVPVVELISLAYAVPNNPSPRLSSLPEWAIRERFDIEAKTSAPSRLETKDIQTQRQTIELLLQKLLSERFGLVLRVRSVTTQVYALKSSGSEQKLTKSAISPRECILDMGSKGCHSFAIGFGHPLNSSAADMFDLAHYLGNWTDLPVVDRTGLTGWFEMHSPGWQPMNLPPPPPGGSGTGAEFANLSTLSAVLRSFGLQLRHEEESLPFYTVESIDQPNAK